jgi:hypothetical protein
MHQYMHALPRVATRRAGNAAARHGEAWKKRKQDLFFFKKKNQKTFVLVERK